MPRLWRLYAAGPRGFKADNIVIVYSARYPRQLLAPRSAATRDRYEKCNNPVAERLRLRCFADAVLGEGKKLKIVDTTGAT